MIVKPHVDWFALAPSLALLAASGLLLMVAVFVPRRGRKPASAFLAFGGFVASGIWAAFLDDRSAHATALVMTASAATAPQRLALRIIAFTPSSPTNLYLERLATHSRDCSWPWRVLITLPLITSVSSLPL